MAHRPQWTEREPPGAIAGGRFRGEPTTDGRRQDDACERRITKALIHAANLNQYIHALTVTAACLVSAWTRRAWVLNPAVGTGGLPPNTHSPDGRGSLPPPPDGQTKR
jgi:hypothetical protein